MTTIHDNRPNPADNAPGQLRDKVADPRRSQRLVGASVGESALYDHLTTHADAESALLEPYQEAAESSPSAAFRYLAGLIVEDEIRHHRLFVDLAESLRSDAEMRSGPAAVPRLDFDRCPDTAHLLKLTRELLEQERRDAKELRHLTKELADMKETTMWALLVEIMQADTAKHIKILRFVERHARP